VRSDTPRAACDVDAVHGGSAGVLWTLADLGAGNSTLSKDLSCARRALERTGGGLVQAIPGPSGGVAYLPICTVQPLCGVVGLLASALGKANRILPGGFVCMTPGQFAEDAEVVPWFAVLWISGDPQH